MDKIVNDLEDFVLPEKELREKSQEEKDAIRLLLYNLIEFTNENNDKYESMNDFRKEFTRYYNKHCRINKMQDVRKIDLILDYRILIEQNKITENIILEKLLCKKPSRSISGIISITLVMSPFPNGQSFSCKHNCYYCPNEPAHKGNNFQAQPRSYLYHEPAVRRANRNSFKAYEQMLDRMNTLFGNGHIIDKLEIIVEGGTYTEYPVEYLEEFNRDTYYAANTFFDNYKRLPLSLEEEVNINKTAKVHIIGICIETRPDALSDQWINHFRESGVTRIQLGVQSTHNHILKKINRGHTVETALEAMEYLKNFGYKIDIHIMPDLPYTTPELDRQMFDYTYSVLQPDQIKIYPCAVVPWTIIEKWYNQGKWVPYTPEVLKGVMDYGMMNCPDWIRLPRVIRDIPGVYIQAGNKKTNLRQTLEVSRDIREREIERHSEYYNKPARIFIEEYTNDDNWEKGIKDYFISYESMDKVALFGFIRLRLPSKDSFEKNNFTINNEILSAPHILFKVLKDKALIRELHVYGYNTEVGKESRASQHRGIGTKLLKEAEKIARRNFYSGIVVISGEGVKEYYRKKGYKEQDTYMYKEFMVNKIINHCNNSNVLNWMIYIFATLIPFILLTKI
jgi:ELP3 family radical SAM enzyme/protein acetyltransferase